MSFGSCRRRGISHPQMCSNAIKPMGENRALLQRVDAVAPVTVTFYNSPLRNEMSMYCRGDYVEKLWTESFI
jgi:hypothetical protein